MAVDSRAEGSRYGIAMRGAWILGLNAAAAVTSWRRRRRIARADGRGSGEPRSPGGETVDDGPLRGWKILGADYADGHRLDGLSLEWDYFMVHSPVWTGMVGYVLVDPRHRLGAREKGPLGFPLNLTPAGAIVAVSGDFIESSECIADFVHFGRGEMVASPTVRRMEATDGESGWYALIEPKVTIEGEESLRLAGRTRRYEWELEVRQDWADRKLLSKGVDAPFSPVRGGDVGLLPGEHFTVDMLWPRTQVRGQIVRRDVGQTFQIQGHGYREDSYGRFSFATDGWDFAVCSCAETGVQFAWQAYRNGLEHKYLDVSFVEGGLTRAVRFRASRGELGWEHRNWQFDRVAGQFAARDTDVVADNGEYRVEAHIEIGARQAPLLSSSTAVTDAYVIMEHFPMVSGSITNVESGEVVARFSAQGGGELASPQRFVRSGRDGRAAAWGRRHYSHPFPQARAPRQ